MTNEIKDTKEKKLYFLNKLILSAFGETKEIDTTSIQTKVKTLENQFQKTLYKHLTKNLSLYKLIIKKLLNQKRIRIC